VVVDRDVDRSDAGHGPQRRERAKGPTIPLGSAVSLLRRKPDLDQSD